MHLRNDIGQRHRTHSVDDTGPARLGQRFDRTCNSLRSMIDAAPSDFRKASSSGRPVGRNNREAEFGQNGNRHGTDAARRSRHQNFALCQA